MNFLDIKKQIKIINEFLTSWLKSHGFADCSALFDSEFSYDFANDIITYSFNYYPKEDDLYLDVCKKYKPELKECDNFIISFFHELGHYVAANDLTDEEWQHYVETVLDINAERSSSPTEGEMLKYYLSDLEYDATKWACDYICNHESEIQQLITQLKQICPSYYEWKELIIN